MAKETSNIIHRDLNFLPLKNFANIFEGNALTLDWQNILPTDINFIFGNPPFIGHQWRTPSQVEDMKIAFHDLDKHGKLDYVCAWYNKAADFIKDTKIECAFVSTNSITQGESVHVLWKFLFNKITINFAFRTFRWDSESNEKAHVHCVIIAFANFQRQQKIIFDGDNKIFAENINGYLLDAPNIFIENRGTPPKNFPKMTKGSQPTDGGNLILSELEKKLLLLKYPQAEKFVKTFLGAEEFLHNKKRYCLWLVDASPAEIKKIPPIFDRIKKVADFRKNSKTKSVRDAADTPTIFTQIRQPKNNFLVIPEVSSERRKYIPIGFLDKNFIASNTVYLISDADLFLFGILQSSVHMAWAKIICGRLESRLRYTPAVYNNFPFPDKNFDKISATAEKILQVRNHYPDSSLADLYDPTLMPKDLRDAHKKNDTAVLEAYGFDKNFSESQIVAELMKWYNEKTKEG